MWHRASGSPALETSKGKNAAMRNLLSLTLGLTFASAAAGCIVTVDDADPDDDGINVGGNPNTGGSGGAPPISGDLLVLSYNAGLSDQFVDHARERAPVTIDAIAEIGAGIVCAQEVFDDNDRAALVSALGSPNLVVAEASPQAIQGACGAEISTLETCVDTSCAGVTDLACLTGACAAEVAAQALPCQACLVATLGDSSDNVAATCSGSAPIFAHDGAFGLALASSPNILAQEARTLSSTLVRRGALYAQIDSAVGPIHTFCTQLSSPDSALPYTGTAGSWEAEHAAQVDALLAFIEEKAPTGAVLVLGDLQTGPAGAGYEALAPNGYDRFIGAGFQNRYIDGDELCTQCADNPLATSSTNAVPDHVLVRGFNGTLGAARVLDDPITIEVGGSDVESAYSHHYGIFSALSN